MIDKDSFSRECDFIVLRDKIRMTELLNTIRNRMLHIQAPAPLSEHSGNFDLFLAGGISNCPNWQNIVLKKLSHTKLTVVNPRRDGEFTEDIADAQIRWEYVALRSVDTVLFWFPSETLCPITLFELGVFSQRSDTKIFVGTDPNYGRRFDVQVQMELSRPEVTVHDSIDALLDDYLSYIA